MQIKILLGGDGGQGIQLISDLISAAAFETGQFVTQVPNYGLEQRGGASLSFVKISDKEIVYPRFSKPDVMLLVSEQARMRTKPYYEDLRFKNEDLRIIDLNDYKTKLEAEKIAYSSYNVFFLGVFTKILADKGFFKKEDVYRLLEKKLSAKPKWEENKRAFELGTNI